MVAMELVVTKATQRAIHISQYKVAAVSCLIIDISATLRLKFAMKMRLRLKNNAVARESLVTIATRQVIGVTAVYMRRKTNFGVKTLLG